MSGTYRRELADISGVSYFLATSMISLARLAVIAMGLSMYVGMPFESGVMA